MRVFKRGMLRFNVTTGRPVKVRLVSSTSDISKKERFVNFLKSGFYSMGTDLRVRVLIFSGWIESSNAWRLYVDLSI